MSQAENKAKALQRDADAKAALLAQQEDHELQLAMRAEEKAAEVAEMLKSVPKEVLREWRFRIVREFAARPDLMGNEKQVQYDHALLEAARYAVTGKV